MLITMWTAPRWSSCIYIDEVTKIKTLRHIESSEEGKYSKKQGKNEIVTVENDKSVDIKSNHVLNSITILKTIYHANWSIVEMIYINFSIILHSYLVLYKITRII